MWGGCGKEKEAIWAGWRHFVERVVWRCLSIQKGNLSSISRDRDFRDCSQPIYYFIPFYTYLHALVQVYEGDRLLSPLS